MVISKAIKLLISLIVASQLLGQIQSQPNLPSRHFQYQTIDGYSASLKDLFDAYLKGIDFYSINFDDVELKYDQSVLDISQIVIDHDPIFDFSKSRFDVTDANCNGHYTLDFNISFKGNTLFNSKDKGTIKFILNLTNFIVNRDLSQESLAYIYTPYYSPGIIETPEYSGPNDQEVIKVLEAKVSDLVISVGLGTFYNLMISEASKIGLKENVGKIEVKYYPELGAPKIPLILQRSKADSCDNIAAVKSFAVTVFDQDETVVESKFSFETGIVASQYFFDMSIFSRIFFRQVPGDLEQKFVVSKDKFQDLKLSFKVQDFAYIFPSIYEEHKPEDEYHLECSQSEIEFTSRKLKCDIISNELIINSFFCEIQNQLSPEIKDTKKVFVNQPLIQFFRVAKDYGCEFDNNAMNDFLLKVVNSIFLKSHAGIEFSASQDAFVIPSAKYPGLLLVEPYK